MKSFKQFYSEAYVEVGPNVVRWIDDDVVPEADELRTYVFQIAVWSGTEKRYNLSKKSEFISANNLVEACRLSRYFERVRTDYEDLSGLANDDTSFKIASRLLNRYGSLDAMCSTEQGIRDMLRPLILTWPVLNVYVRPLGAAISAVPLAPLIMGFDPATIENVKS